MRKVSRRTKAVLAVVSIVVVAVNGGIAWAYWRTTGTASATATAGSVVPLLASGQPAGNAALYPGVRRNLRVTIRNDNTFPVLVTQVKRGSGPVVVDASHASSCVNTGVSLTNAIYGVALTVGKNSTASITLADGLRMTNASASGCQGATFRVPVVVVGQAQP